MKSLRRLFVALALISVETDSLTSLPDHAAATRAPIVRMEADRDAADQELARLEQRLRLPDDDERFDEAAQIAWRFVDEHVQPQTGLVAPVRNYPFATIWDVASMLAALYSARELGLVNDATYTSRVRAILATLARVKLYDGAVFGRSYDTQSGALIAHQPKAGPVVGWSAIDIGRLLIWLRIVSTDPALAQAAADIAHRNDMSRLVKAGYLWGSDLDQFGTVATYPEGRIGYEQYSAQGFALWGYRADKALNLMENAVPITVAGQTLLADVRQWDRLTNEPFLLLGLELGLDRQMSSLVRRLVLAQEARYQEAGALTMAGEDAIAQPPHYFYYYCVYSNGKAFSLDVQDRQASVDAPRWVSAKSAFALHALMPSRYSERAIRSLDAGRQRDGWASGIYESTGASTGTANINTAAVILTAALVHRTGKPILAWARGERTGATR